MMRRLVFNFGKSMAEVGDLSLAELEWWYLSAIKNSKDQPIP